MDKVKVILGYAGKYHFWLLCAVAVLLGTFGWMKARGALTEEYERNKSTVTGKFSSLDGIRNASDPPNEKWTTAISALTKQEQQEVAVTWNTVYETQKKVLAWPEVMPDTFHSWIGSHTPSEDIPAIYLQAYQNEVLRSEFPKLAKIVQAAPMEADSRSTAPGAPPARTPAAPANPPSDSAATATYRVNWGNQDTIYKDLGFPSGVTPTTLQVHLRQEDYWVYQALLNIVRKTNDAAPHVPYIKVIEDLRIGAKAADLYTKGMAPGHIEKVTSTEGGEGGGSSNVDAGGGAEGQQPAPDEGRYLQKDGTALPAGTAQTEQFKRLPIYMKLVMDQREITRLLTECANYPLPVEVRQLRIMPVASQSGGQGAAQTTSASKPGEAYDVLVEVNGIIYLFNPPDPAKLGTGAAETQAAG